MALAIDVAHLSRAFGTFKAVDDLTFEVQEGEVFGVLGPNGAGKTTTVRLLNGVLAPTSGQARVLGFDPVTQGSEVRSRTGVLTETPSLSERLSARDNLSLFGAMYGVPDGELPARVAGTLELLGLGDRADDMAGTYSKGMKQRLAIARALIHEPPLLFLDEPTSGLDPESSQQVTELIATLAHQEGRTVFLATHNLAMAERLCDRVALFNRGRLLAVGTREELARRLGAGHSVEVDLLAPCDARVSRRLQDLAGVSEVRVDGTRFEVRIDAEGRIPEVVALLVAEGAPIRRVLPHEPTLADIYFTLQHPEEVMA